MPATVEMHHGLTGLSSPKVSLIPYKSSTVVEADIEATLAVGPIGVHTFQNTTKTGKHRIELLEGGVLRYWCYADLATTGHIVASDSAREAFSIPDESAGAAGGLALVGSAMALAAGAATDIAAAVWAATSRTITGLTQAALALFASQDTGQTEAVTGSVVALSKSNTSSISASVSRRTFDGGPITLIRTGDYITAVGGEFDWSLANAGSLPSFAGWTAETRIRIKNTSHTATSTSIVVATGSTRSGIIQIANAASALQPGTGEYQVWFKDASENQICLISGICTLKQEN